MSVDENVDIRVRLRGGKVAAVEARTLAGALDDVGGAGRRAGSGLGFANAAGAGVKRTLSDVGGAARSAAFGIGALATVTGGFALRAGLKFNATMEQNHVAFTNLLGSSSKATAKLEELYQLAKVTPFEFPELVQAQTRLMGFGMEGKRATSILKTLGDAVAGAGGGTEEVKRATYALGQMQARGKITMEELNQLAEARIPALKIIGKELGLSKAELGNIGREGIEANKGIDALQKGLDKLYGGQAAKQAKTFNGQLSTLKDNVNQTLGSVTEGGFQELRDKVFPALNDTAQGISDVFKRTDLDTEEKLRRSRTIVRREMGPLAREVELGIRRAHLDDKLATFVENALPKVANAAAQAAPKAAGAFVTAWLNMGPWGKLFTLGLLAKRLGVFGVLGKRASARFGAGWGVTIGPELSKQTGKAAPAAKGFGSKVGKVAGAAMVAAMAVGVYQFLHDVALEVPALAQYSGSKGWGELWRDAKDWLPGEDSESKRKRQKADGPNARRWSHGQNPLLGSSGPGAFPPPRATPRSMPKRPKLAPRAKTSVEHGADWAQPITTQVFLDGKQIAEAVGRRVDDRKNRR